MLFRSTVIIISHSMEDMAEYCEDVIVMNHARVMLSGTVHDVFSDSDLLAQAGLDIPQITQVMRMLAASGLDVDTGVCTKEQATAELIRALKLSF